MQKSFTDFNYFIFLSRGKSLENITFSLFSSMEYTSVRLTIFTSYVTAIDEWILLTFYLISSILIKYHYNLP